jgi:DNA-binding PadR family transcriptional regulator
LDTKTLCLGVLMRSDATGYEIRKAFEEGPFGRFQDAAFGSIYPALRRLADEGAVVTLGEVQDGRPERKVYRITDQGRQSFMQAMTVMPAEDRFRSDFAFMLLFADCLPSGFLGSLVDARIAHYKAKLEQHGDGKDLCLGNVQRPGETFVSGMNRAVIEAALRYLQDNQAWLMEHAMAGETTVSDAASEDAQGPRRSPRRL